MLSRRIGIVVVALIVAASGSVARAQFEEDGFFLFLETVLTTPKNTDEVIAVNIDTSAGAGDLQTQEQILADWGSDPAGRLQFGYRWASGSTLSLTYWGFDNDQRTKGDGPPGNSMYFGIGPTIYYNGSDFGAYGYYGHHDIVTSIEANSLEIEAGRRYDMSDAFELEWSVGVRWADFDEDFSGFYDLSESTFPGGYGYYRYAANKRNKSEMAGLMVGGRGAYRFGEALSINSGLSFSFLEGEVTSESGLVPSGIINAGTLPSSSFVLKDNNRSGSIVDFDLNVVWHLMDDRYRLWLGYEYSQWNGLTVDLARQQTGIPGRQTTFGTRDSITFSGVKIGVGFLF